MGDCKESERGSNSEYDVLKKRLEKSLEINKKWLSTG